MTDRLEKAVEDIEEILIQTIRYSDRVKYLVELNCASFFNNTVSGLRRIKDDVLLRELQDTFTEDVERSRNVCQLYLKKPRYRGDRRGPQTDQRYDQGHAKEIGDFHASAKAVEFQESLKRVSALQPEKFQHVDRQHHAGGPSGRGGCHGLTADRRHPGSRNLSKDQGDRR